MVSFANNRSIVSLAVSIVCLISIPFKSACCLESKPATFPLHFVSLGEKQVTPQMAFLVNFLNYGPYARIGRFTGKHDTSTPEGVVTDYIHLLTQKQPDLTAARRLFSTTEPGDMIDDRISGSRRHMEGISPVAFARRYDVGSLSFVVIRAGVRGYPDESLTFVTRKMEGRYFMTVHATPNTAPEPLVSTLIESVEYNFAFHGRTWVSIPQPSYRYSFRVPAILTLYAPGVNPAYVLFNGRVKRVPVTGPTIPGDAVSRFMRKVVSVYRREDGKQFLPLWTESDRQSFWNAVVRNPDKNYFDETERVQRGALEIAFTMEFGPETVVYLADSKDIDLGLQLFVLWRGNGKNYHLTRGAILIHQAGTRATEDTLVLYVRTLLEAGDFQTFIQQLIKRERRKNDA